MSTPAYQERWANPTVTAQPPVAPVTVPAGQAGFPAVVSGDVQTWPMAGGISWFPRANPGQYAPSVLRIFDLAAPTEIIRVLDNGTANWQVQRGDQGTTPVPHAAGFSVWNAVTAAGLAGLQQGVPSGNGLALPRAGRTGSWLLPVTPIEAKCAYMVAGIGIPAGEAVRASVYEAVAWGFYHDNNNNASGTNSQQFGAGARWGLLRRWDDPTDWAINYATGLGPGVNLGQASIPITWTVNPAFRGGFARWRIHATLTVYDGAAHCSTMVTLGEHPTVLEPTPANPTGHAHTYLIGQADGTGGGGTQPVPTATDQGFYIHTGLPNNGTAQRIRVTGGYAWRCT